MAYGRDAQAEEILKEALQKDSSRIPVHAKLLEIYANRKDAKSFEQTALKLKGLTKRQPALNGTRPRRSAARSIRATACTQVPALRVRGRCRCAPHRWRRSRAGTDARFRHRRRRAGSASAPDLTLDAAPKAGRHRARFRCQRRDAEEGPFRRTLEVPTPRTRPRAASTSTSISARLRPKPAAPAAPAAPPAADDPGLTFDLNLDLGDNKAEAPPSAPPPAADLSSISLDLGGAAEPRPRRAAPIRNGRKSPPSSTSPRPTKRWATRTARASC